MITAAEAKKIIDSGEVYDKVLKTIEDRIKRTAQEGKQTVVYPYPMMNTVKSLLETNGFELELKNGVTYISW